MVSRLALFLLSCLEHLTLLCACHRNLISVGHLPARFSICSSIHVHWNGIQLASDIWTPRSLEKKCHELECLLKYPTVFKETRSVKRNCKECPDNRFKLHYSRSLNEFGCKVSDPFEISDFSHWGRLYRLYGSKSEFGTMQGGFHI